MSLRWSRYYSVPGVFVLAAAVVIMAVVVFLLAVVLVLV